MSINENNSIISEMTEKERQNPSLLKDREEYQNSLISVYYGSAKKELVNVCLDCKRKDECKSYKDVRQEEYMLQVGLRSKQIMNEINISEEERQKLMNNVFIVVNCKIKEEIQK